MNHHLGPPDRPRRVRGIASTCAVVALWLALFGLAALVLHYAVVEVICIELAALVVALLSTGLFIADSQPTCGHEIDCSTTRGGR